MSRGRVLVLANEPVTESMAGPAIRAWELAHLLARNQSVTLGTPNDDPMQSSELRVVGCGRGSLPSLLSEHDVVVASGYPLRRHPIIRQRASHLVIDIYDPYLVEDLHLHRGLAANDRVSLHQYHIDVTLEHLEAGDFFICASERQRDYWLGALSLANRINPLTYEADPTLRRLVDVVSFGLPSQPPTPTRGAVKGVVPGIRAEDLVAIWGGGVWDWLDPLTAIKAMASLKESHPRLKLYFMGLRHPSPSAPSMVMPERAMRLAQDLGLLGRSVFFGEGWVPYQERTNYLCDADIAISLHREHLETRLAFRTRILDYLWASLPIISTKGDTLCDSIVSMGAGISVGEGDVEGVRRALCKLADEPDARAQIREHIRTLVRDYTWSNVSSPLLTYCQDPWRAADRHARGLVHPSMGRRRLLIRRVLQVMRTSGREAAVNRVHQWLDGVREMSSLIPSRRAK